MSTSFRTRWKTLDGSLSALPADGAPPRVMLRRLADRKGQVGQLRTIAETIEERTGDWLLDEIS